MPCEPEITVLSQSATEITFVGTCKAGTCPAEGGCKAKLTLPNDGKINKNSKIKSTTGNDWTSSSATVCVTSTFGDDEDNGSIELQCKCGSDDKTPATVSKSFTVSKSAIEEFVGLIPHLIKLLGK
jgi:hypothetical protein